MAHTNPSVVIYTDGSSLGNPGPGGYAAILEYRAVDRTVEKVITGGEPETTNNKMEMIAVIEGLKALTKKASVTVYTDSRYVSDGITKWLPNWKKNGFKTANKKPVANKDLWEELDKLVQKHDVAFKWVKGHAGHERNEQADRLAQYEAARFNRE